MKIGWKHHNVWKLPIMSQFFQTTKQANFWHFSNFWFKKKMPSRNTSPKKICRMIFFVRVLMWGYSHRKLSGHRIFNPGNSDKKTADFPIYFHTKLLHRKKDGKVYWKPSPVLRLCTLRGNLHCDFWIYVSHKEKFLRAKKNSRYSRKLSREDEKTKYHIV